MKLLYIYMFCSLGGVETALKNRIKYLDKKNKIDLLFFSDVGGKKIFTELNCNIYVINNSNEIIQLINDKKYDVITSIDTPIAYKFIVESNFQGKFIMETHTTYKEGIKYLSGMKKEIIDYIFVPSEYERKLVNLYNNQKIRVKVIPNSIDSEKFYYKDFNFKYEKSILMWVGRLDEHKNWRMFLKIIKKCLEKQLNIEAWVIGGKKSDPEEILEFQKIILRYKLAGFIKWFPHIENECMSNVYSIVSNSNGALISTSNCESFGMTLIEAMACKCAVIANNVGAIPEIIKNNVNGKLLDMSDDKLELIIQEIDVLLNNDSLRNSMINNSYKFIGENYIDKRISEKYEEFLKYIVNEG